MTKHNVDPLQKQYDLRKRRHKAPRAVRELIMNKARNEQQHFWQRFNLLNWTLGVSALSALLLLYQFVSVYIGVEGESPVQYQTVQIHRLHQETSSPLSDTDKLNQQLNIRLADNYSRYLQSNDVLTTHHSQTAQLLSTKNGWKLKTCDDQIVQITHQLVNVMLNAHLLQKNIKQGQQVNIQFDQDGRITGIKARKVNLSC